ncbi:MAG TPA: type IV toxin-antitoxin system AbiEi family antitoxin domain-containing protein [Clostridia bacterium]|jgi:predicted transcriptional regulator of viral defense system|nr:type IV toxin-antitoxin system AbiEi family antitoxin domain-containing protein [Clostridia bacterium]
MDYAKQIEDKMKKAGGVITSKEVSDSNIPTIYLTRMEKAGEIIRVDRGIYILPDGDYDEYYFFQKRFKVAIFSYASALYLHQFTDIIPEQKEITVYKGYNPHRISDNVKIHYVTKPIYDLGVTERETIFGNSVKVYDMERTICDLVKSRNEMETELFSKTINQYVRDRNKDLHKLYEYSKKMKIYEKVKEILDIVC